MFQNASPEEGSPDGGSVGSVVAGVEEDIVVRTAQRAVARRQAAYADEVRRLLDAGLEVMRRYGTTRSPRVADILAEAGLSRDAFYRHFASKENLVVAIVEAGAERLVSYLRHQMDKEDDPADKLRRWVQGIVSQAANQAVADATRAVYWNGNQVAQGTPADVGRSDGPLARLIVEPLRQLGSTDPRRDASLMTYAAVGLMS